MFTTTRRLFLGLLVLAACGSTESNHKKPAPASAPAPTAAAGTEVGYFAGGCFWGVEHFLEQLPGVLDVESGYMGGALDAPSYEQVSSGDSGHAETVRVTFDPQKIGYEAVAKRFFEIHDPTEIDRQGPDIGTQYRSAVFVTGPEQRTVASALIARLKANGYAVATTVEDAGRFWPAEEYHQNYYVRTRKTPYCHMPVPRFDQPARS
ncbi:peptide-methionine (S)-S-oxide reductase MsrA [Nannocystis sp. SCPEA4]|uniref:peptide-methionine (S)-S-oxide reductase MsrA n=1 Tax=Nannocystis sp. SCPEA4 TaxID=2996787 RepID=UPI0022720E16|nr:peptide-methionine (S)-S-oxide reductase MsrA [Nannocystis sp. SCPEA4]MCY1054494.1 peptide-methionine (S)-S-oxide reductase MsrA [Nannocystis sp. SCPEA4]